jgi:hypothetical protein
LLDAFPFTVALAMYYMLDLFEYVLFRIFFRGCCGKVNNGGGGCRFGVVETK